MEEATQPPVTQRAQAVRRLWQPDEMEVLLDVYGKYEPIFRKREYTQNGIVRVMTSKDYKELWYKAREDVYERLPYLRGVFRGNNPVKAKIAALKNDHKKLLEASKATGPGGITCCAPEAE